MDGRVGFAEGFNGGCHVVAVMEGQQVAPVVVAVRFSGTFSQGVAGYGGGSTVRVFHSGGGIEAGGGGVLVGEAVEVSVEPVVSEVEAVRVGGTFAQGVAGYSGGASRGMSHGQFAVGEGGAAGVVDVVVAVVVEGKESVRFSRAFSEVGARLVGVAATGVVLNKAGRQVAEVPAVAVEVAVPAPGLGKGQSGHAQ